MTIDDRSERLKQDILGIIDIKLLEVFPKFATANPNTLIDEGRYNSISHYISNTQNYMMTYLSDRATLDSHKLASLAAISLLSAKILVLRDDENKLCEFPYANEIFAFEVSMHVVTRFQVYRSCKELNISNHYDKVIDEYNKENTSYYFMAMIDDVDTVDAYLVKALHHAFQDGGSNESLSWLLSSIFYFIDMGSYSEVKALVEKITRDLKITGNHACDEETLTG